MPLFRSILCVDLCGVLLFGVTLKVDLGGLLNQFIYIFTLVAMIWGNFVCRFNWIVWASPAPRRASPGFAGLAG